MGKNKKSLESSREEIESLIPTRLNTIDSIIKLYTMYDDIYKKISQQNIEITNQDVLHIETIISYTNIVIKQAKKYKFLHSHVTYLEELSDFYFHILDYVYTRAIKSCED